MISELNPRWRAVRLENEESVLYLQRLLRAGWYLMQLDVDGLSTLSFHVPVKPPPSLPGKVMVYGQTMETFTMVVLRKGKKKGRQIAVAVFRNESGELHMSQIESPGDEWRFVTNLWTENRGVVYIYEKKVAEGYSAADS